MGMNAAADTIMDMNTKATTTVTNVAADTTTAMTMDTITVMTMAAAVVAAVKRWRKNITTTLRTRKWQNTKTMLLM